MFRWFIVFSFRRNPEASVEIGNAVISTLTDFFSFVRVAQKISDQHSFSDVMMHSWKLMKEVEYLDYEKFQQEKVDTRDL